MHMPNLHNEMCIDTGLALYFFIFFIYIHFAQVLLLQYNIIVFISSEWEESVTWLKESFLH